MSASNIFKTVSRGNQKLYVCYVWVPAIFFKRDRGVEIKEGKEKNRLTKEKKWNHCTYICTNRHNANMLIHIKH